MKLYSSFLTRCWVIRDSSPEPKFVFEVEHIQSGARRKHDSLEEIQQWMLTILQTQEPEAKPATDDQFEAGR